MNDWIFYESLPPMDGTYEARMDEDDEPMIIYVRGGRAYNNIGDRHVFVNYEWRKIST